MANPKGDADDPPKNFTFDAVFGADVTQVLGVVGQQPPGHIFFLFLKSWASTMSLKSELACYLHLTLLWCSASHLRCVCGGPHRGDSERLQRHFLRVRNQNTLQTHRGLYAPELTLRHFPVKCCLS